jgi:hypothetical protein
MLGLNAKFNTFLTINVFNYNKFPRVFIETHLFEGIQIHDTTINSVIDKSSFKIPSKKMTKHEYTKLFPPVYTSDSFES